MRLVQANLGRGVSVAEYVANLDRILEAWGPRAVYCFQEIDEADKPEEMDILRGRVYPTHTIVGERTAVPILIPHHLAVTDTLVTPACKGLALFTPNRVINEAVVRLGPNLAPAILNTHLPIARPETAGRRLDVRRALRERARAHDAGVWVADTNSHSGWPTIVRGERTVTDAEIDKAKAWAQTARRVVVSERRTVQLTIDGHNAHGARVLFEPA